MSSHGLSRLLEGVGEPANWCSVQYEYLAQQLEGINIQIDPERIQKAVEVQLAQVALLCPCASLDPLTT